MAQRRPVSISDIARVAGVSHPTVSRALKNSPLISEDVRERIQRLAAEMGYTPNAIAQSLQTRRSHTLGLVVTSIADPFFTDVVKGVEEVASPAHFGVFLSASYNNPVREVEVIETFSRRRVDGILVASSRISSNYEEQLGRIKVPTVLINNETVSSSDLLNWVAVDDRRGGQLATSLLLELGHTRIGYLGVANRPRSNQQRFEAYRSSLVAAGIAADEALVVIGSAPTELGQAPSLHNGEQNNDVAAGYHALQRLRGAGATAVFCYNDMVAVGALLACRDQGIAVPSELSIVGYDDIELTRYTSPALTTIHQPSVLLGSLAAQMLFDLLNDRAVQNHSLPPSLVVRGSAAPPTNRSSQRGEMLCLLWRNPVNSTSE